MGEGNRPRKGTLPMRTPDHLIPFEELLYEVNRTENRAQTLVRNTNAATEDVYGADCVADREYLKALNIFRSTSITVDQIEVTLDVIEHINCQGGDPKRLVKLVLIAFETLKEAQ